MARRYDPWSSLRFPEYRAFLLAMATVFAASQVESTVLGWQIYSITHDPLSLGLMGLSEALPFLALTLLGGWEADRRDRRALSLWGLAAVGLSGVTLLAVSFAPLRNALPLYGAQVLAGVGRAFFRPASGALGSELVPREHYHNAASWRSSIFQVATVLGPALGGGLIALGGPRVAYAVVVGLLALGFLALALVRPRPRPVPPALGAVDALGEGVRFVFSQPLLLGPMSLDLFAVLFGGATALLPAFAADVLHVDEVGFGLLRAAPAAGSVLMSLWLARRGELERSGPVLLWAVALFGGTWMTFALSRSYALSLALLAVGGALDNVSVVLRSTLVQVRTPQAMMGRVSAVNGFFIGSSNELGAFESGVAARVLGLVPSVLFGGAMTLATVGWVAWKVPALRALGRIHALEEGGAGKPAAAP